MKQIIKMLWSMTLGKKLPEEQVRAALEKQVSEFAREDVFNSLVERVAAGELPPWKLRAEIERINEDVEK